MVFIIRKLIWNRIALVKSIKAKIVDKYKYNIVSKNPATFRGERYIVVFETKDEKLFYHMLKYQGNTSIKGFVVMLCIVSLLVIINLYRLIFIFPRKYIIFQNNKMYYNNGFKEICVDSINGIRTFVFGWRTSYWYVILNINNNKRLFIDVLLYSQPESLFYTINHMSN